MSRRLGPFCGKQGSREREVRIRPEGDTASLSLYITVRICDDGICIAQSIKVARWGVEQVEVAHDISWYDGSKTGEIWSLQ